MQHVKRPTDNPSVANAPAPFTQGSLIFLHKKFLIFSATPKRGGFLFTLHNFNVSQTPNFGRVSYLQNLFGMLQWTQQGHPESEKRKEQTKRGLAENAKK